MEAGPESAEDRASLEATPGSSPCRRSLTTGSCGVASTNGARQALSTRRHGRRRSSWRAWRPRWRRPSPRSGRPAVATKRRPIGVSRMAQPEGRPRHRWPLWSAAAVATCLALLVVPSLLRQIGSDYTTATAELRGISLQDGSEVILAPASAIAVSYDVGERRVRLLSGEAFFWVTPGLRASIPRRCPVRRDGRAGNALRRPHGQRGRDRFRRGRLGPVAERRFSQGGRKAGGWRGRAHDLGRRYTAQGSRTGSRRRVARRAARRAGSIASRSHRSASPILSRHDPVDRRRAGRTAK